MVKTRKYSRPIQCINDPTLVYSFQWKEYYWSGRILAEVYVEGVPESGKDAGTVLGTPSLFLKLKQSHESCRTDRTHLWYVLL